jgi:hypothetical protein
VGNLSSELNRRRRALVALLPLAFAGGTIIGVVTTGSQSVAGSTTPSEGTFPSSLPSNGDTSGVPDYIAVTSNGSVVGYIPKSDMITPANQPVPDISSVPVYNAALTSIVGQMVASVGFVPNGATPGPAITPTTWGATASTPSS